MAAAAADHDFPTGGVTNEKPLDEAGGSPEERKRKEAVKSKE